MRGSIRAADAQSVAFVELFFDLVFVFAVTQLTVLTAHDLTPDGILRSILLGWLIWWAWTQFTWTLNPADTTHPVVRIITLTATGVALVMAASVPRAFADDALWFAAPYVLVRVLGLGLQVWVDRDGSTTAVTPGVVRWVGLSTIGLVLVLVGAVVDPTVRPWVWLLAILADLVAAVIAGRNTTWDLNPAHLSERHGLFVIIAIGESLIVAGTAVANDERSLQLAAAAFAAIIVACLLWWTYFGWLKDALEHLYAAAPPERNGPLARDAFSLGHFPLIGGIVGFAVATRGDRRTSRRARAGCRPRVTRHRCRVVRGQLGAVHPTVRWAPARAAAGDPRGDAWGARPGGAAAAGLAVAGRSGGAAGDRRHRGLGA